MSYGIVKRYFNTMTTGSTLTSHFDLSERSWDKIYFSIPTMPSGTDFYVQGAAAQSEPFRRVHHPVINTSSAQSNTFVIGSGTTDRLVLIPNGIRFVKIEQSTAMTDTATIFNLICSD